MIFSDSDKAMTVLHEHDAESTESIGDRSDAGALDPTLLDCPRGVSVIIAGVDLDEDGIMAVMSEQKANQREYVSIPVQDIRRFFPAEYSIRDIQRSILRMLEEKNNPPVKQKQRSRGVER